MPRLDLSEMDVLEGVVVGVHRPGWPRAARVAEGVLDPEQRTPLRPEDGFRAASVTKLVTASCVAQCARRGELDLDAPIVPLVKDRLPRAWQDPDSPVATITARELLSHRAGLPDYTTHAFDQGFIADHHRWRPEELLEIAAGIREVPARGAFHYADTGYVLLGILLEKVAGRPLHGVYREELFGPLGMEQTWLEGRESARGRISHHFRGTRDLIGINPSFDWAGGGLVTTVDDLLKLIRGVPLEDLSQWQDVPQNHPHRSRRYGYGLAEIEIAGEKLVGHGGVWGAFVFLHPRSGTAFAGTVNQFGPFGIAARPLLEELVEELGLASAPAQG